MENFDELQNTYNKYLALLRKFFPDNHEAVDKLESEIGDRLFLAPQALDRNLGGVPGGLVSFTCNVAKFAKTFKDVVDQRKLVRVSLIHELGRLGGPDEHSNLFVTEDSDWHREKLGRDYKYNEFCTKMSSAHRTLFYVARYGFQVDEEEWIALTTSAGFQYDENRFYANEVLPLATALQACRTFALKEMM